MALRWLVPGERLVRRQVAGAALVLPSGLVIARPGGAGPLARLGDAMSATAGLMFAGFTLLVRRWGVAPVPATGELPGSWDWLGMAVASLGLAVATGALHRPRC